MAVMHSRPFWGFLHKPTVCLDATSLVVCSYGCDDSRIGPTNCALIGGALGDREGGHHLMEILAQFLGIKMGDDFIEDFGGAILHSAEDQE
jgi:hypothetical protein